MKFSESRRFAKPPGRWMQAGERAVDSEVETGNREFSNKPPDEFLINSKSIKNLVDV
jgi:hypothetical protein